MAGTTIDGRSVSDVLNNYDLRAEGKNFKPYYCVKAGGVVKFSHLTDDITAGREYLETNLMAKQLSAETCIFSICYYRHLDKKGEVIGTPEVFNVRLNEVQNYLPMQSQSVNNEVLTTLKTIEGRLAALESEEEEEEEEEQGFLSGFYKDPDMKRALMQMLISGLGGNKTPQTINGVPGQDPQNESDKIRTALKVIAQHTKTLGDDLLKLASMAENDPAQFNFLLTMLRK